MAAFGAERFKEDQQSKSGSGKGPVQGEGSSTGEVQGGVQHRRCSRGGSQSLLETRKLDRASDKRDIRPGVGVRI